MENVIREIATQLGVGVNQIWDMAPSYADMMCFYYLTILMVEAVIFVPMTFISRRQLKKDEDNEIAFIALIIGSIGFFVLMITACIIIPDFIQWRLYPQEQFLRFLASR